MEIKKNKVFISHSNKDVEIVKAFVELLEDIGMPEDSIVCTSVEHRNTNKPERRLCGLRGRQYRSACQARLTNREQIFEKS